MRPSRSRALGGDHRCRRVRRARTPATGYRCSDSSSGRPLRAPMSMKLTRCPSSRSRSTSEQGLTQRDGAFTPSSRCEMVDLRVPRLRRRRRERWRGPRRRRSARTSSRGSAGRRHAQRHRGRRLREACHVVELDRGCRLAGLLTRRGPQEVVWLTAAGTIRSRATPGRGWGGLAQAGRSHARPPWRSTSPSDLLALRCTNTRQVRPRDRRPRRVRPALRARARSRAG